jgi:hypothetical protein
MFCPDVVLSLCGPNHQKHPFIPKINEKSRTFLGPALLQPTLQLLVTGGQRINRDLVDQVMHPPGTQAADNLALR